MSRFHIFKTRSKLFSLIGIFVLETWLAERGEAYMVENNPHHRKETLDPQGNYQLEWEVDWTRKSVTFSVTVKTKGYVGFGLSRNGKMTGADIVIGGVFPNGTVYFTDYHAVANRIPDIDPSQDWNLISAWENRSHTFLTFSRPFDTSRLSNYYRIALLWGYGEIDDQLSYHHQYRGVYNVHLLHPDYTPQIVRSPGGKDSRIIGRENSDIKVWSIPRRIQLAAQQETTYWCTMHKVPRLGRKHHVVGFDVVLPTELSQKHAHHLIVNKCRAPPGYDPSSLFGPFVGHLGQSCLALMNPEGPMLTEYCDESFVGWAVGSRPFFNPPHVGLPFAESQDEYYLVQVHYDNPELQNNIEVDVQIDMFYTSKLRPHEGGMLIVTTPPPGLTPSILVPPSSISHTVYSHCGPQCTQRFLDKEGINIYALNLHSHNSGKQLKFRHFRDNVELPWIASDDTYAFNYQQFRVLTEEHKVLPGDQLTMNCVYDNTWPNGTVVGGFSSRQEMCMTFALYYNKITDLTNCGSDLVVDAGRRRFLGITNITWSLSDVEYVVDPPQRLAGLRISQVSDNHVTWDIRRRKDLQKFHLRESQTGFCPVGLDNFDVPPRSFPRNKHGWIEHPDDFRENVAYPIGIRPYQPKPTC